MTTHNTQDQKVSLAKVALIVVSATELITMTEASLGHLLEKANRLQDDAIVYQASAAAVNAQYPENVIADKRAQGALLRIPAPRNADINDDYDDLSQDNDIPATANGDQIYRRSPLDFLWYETGRYLRRLNREGKLPR